MTFASVSSILDFGAQASTDLNQAQMQLQQLAQFRAASGHTRVPSFGFQNPMNLGPGQSHVGQGNQQMRKSLFAPYLPQASIPPLLAAGKLVIGVLRVHKRNRSDAYVATDSLDSDIYICGSKDRNRALEGDMVAVELLDVDEVWGTKKEKEEKKRKKEENQAFDSRVQQNNRREDKKRDDVEVEGQGLTLFEEEEVNDEQRPNFAGHIVAVVERMPGQLFSRTLGLLRPSSATTKEKQEAERREREGVDFHSGQREEQRPKIVWHRPTDKRVPLIAIPVDQAPVDFLAAPNKYSSTLFIAGIKRWPIASLHPFGTLVCCQVPATITLDYPRTRIRGSS
jgi:protein SSD1